MLKILIYVSISASFFPLGITFFRRINPKYNYVFKAIKPFLWLIFIGGFYEFIFTVILRIPSDYWFTAYTFLEFLTLWYFFKKLFQLRYKYFFYSFLTLVSLGFCIILYYWEPSIHIKLESYLTVPISIFIFTSSFLWLKELFDKEETVSLLEKPTFYFVNGLVVYFAGSIFVSLLVYDLKIITGVVEKYWSVFVIMATIMRVMLIIGVWVGTVRKP